MIKQFYFLKWVIKSILVSKKIFLSLKFKNIRFGVP